MMNSKLHFQIHSNACLAHGFNNDEVVLIGGLTKEDNASSRMAFSFNTGGGSK